MTEYQPEIEVYAHHFKTAIRHGMELWWDGSTPTKRLDQRNGRDGFTRFVNARAEGKLAEVAFKQFLKFDFGIDSQVDWRIYGEYETTDEGDLQYLVGDDGEQYTPSVEFDLKKTKPWNQWLAIRREIFDPHPENAPFILTKLVLEEDMVLDEWEDTDDWETVATSIKFNERLQDYAGDHFPLDVKLVGSAYKDEFTDEFEQGDHLYNPYSGSTLGGPLRRPNAGIHVNDLKASKQRWNDIVSSIVGDNPISYDEL